MTNLLLNKNYNIPNVQLDELLSKIQSIFSLSLVPVAYISRYFIIYHDLFLLELCCFNIFIRSNNNTEKDREINFFSFFVFFTFGKFQSYMIWYKTYILFSLSVILFSVGLINCYLNFVTYFYISFRATTTFFPFYFLFVSFKSLQLIY